MRGKNLCVVLQQLLWKQILLWVLTAAANWELRSFPVTGWGRAFLVLFSCLVRFGVPLDPDLRINEDLFFCQCPTQRIIIPLLYGSWCMSQSGVLVQIKPWCFNQSVWFLYPQREGEEVVSDFSLGIFCWNSQCSVWIQIMLVLACHAISRLDVILGWFYWVFFIFKAKSI